MKTVFILIQAVSFIFILGCSSKGDSVNRFLYGTGQNYDQKQCQENPTADCGSKKSYDQYKKERAEILKEEITTRAIAQENQKLITCPYPGAPVNWVLRYCAIEYQTDDEIFLQKSECYINALADLHSKGNACLIKEKYKRKYCKVRVEKYRTRKSVTLCLEDPSIKPFFSGR